jgi:hypothetical protein
VQGNQQHNAVESLLAYALSLNGVPSRIFLCDEVLTACEWKTALSFPGQQFSEKAFRNHCNRCEWGGHAMFNAFRLPVTPLSAFSFPGALQQAQRHINSLSRQEIFDLTYKKIHLGPIIKSSVVRFFLTPFLPENPQGDQLIRSYAASAVLMVDILEQVLNQLQPRSILTSHGIYISWGIITEMAKQRGIPVSVFWLGKRKATLNLDQGDPWSKSLTAESNANWENLSLSPAQRQRVEQFLLGRLQSQEDRLTYYKSPTNDSADIARQLDLDPAKPTLGLFPNVLWDSEVYYRNIAFPDMVTWIWDTINFFSQHKEFQLVIRVHPGESTLPNLLQHQVHDAIQRRFRVLPANVRIVPPESRIDSYALTSFIAAGAVHATQFGLELAVRGKPVIVTGSAPFRGKGFSHDINSSEQYRLLLASLGSLPPLTPVQQERAWKYAYHLFFRHQVPFKFLEPGPQNTIANIRLNNLQDLAPGSDRALDTIVAAIQNGTAALFDPD